MRPYSDKCLQVSLADASVYSALEFITPAAPDCWEKRENLTRLWKAFSNHPAIANWLKERPESTF